MLVLDEGDDVVVPEPMYLTYEATFRAAGAKLIRVPMRPENEFHLLPPDLEKAITPKTKAIVFATPGQSHRRDVLTQRAGSDGEDRNRARSLGDRR